MLAVTDRPGRAAPLHGPAEAAVATSAVSCSISVCSRRISSSGPSARMANFFGWVSRGVLSFQPRSTLARPEAVCDSCNMTSDSTVSVSEAQANLPRLIRQDSFAIARHGKVVGVFLSKDRMEALVESMELLANPEFSKALKEHQSGKTKFYDVAELDAEMSA